MRNLKMIFFGAVIGILLGLWFGVNIGKDRAIFSNPFAEASIKQKAKNAATGVIKDTKDAIRKSLD